MCLRDPLIPDGERTVYDFAMGESSCTVVEVVSVKRENAGEVYEIISKSRIADKKVKIDRKTMSVFYAETVARNEKSIIQRSAALLKDESAGASDEIKMLDFNALGYMLRAFPFKTAVSARIVSVGARDMFPVRVRVAGMEKISTPKGAIECYKLELGVTGIMGILFPKSYMWYSIEPPHILVRSDSPKGAGGFPASRIELLEYSAGK